MRNVRVSFKVIKIGKFIITNKQQTSQLFISMRIILFYLIKLFPVMAKPFEILQKALVIIVFFVGLTFEHGNDFKQLMILHWVKSKMIRILTLEKNMTRIMRFIQMI